MKQPRAASLPPQRRLVQNEAVQAEQEAHEAERSETGDHSISEGISAESQEIDNGLPSSKSSQKPKSRKSTKKETVEEDALEESAEAKRAAVLSVLDSYMPGPGLAELETEHKDAYNRSRESIAQSSTVYIGNMNFDTDEGEIEQFLKGAGKINDVRLIKDARGFSRGFVTRAVRQWLDTF